MANNTQRNYKKQIDSALKSLERKAKRGEGPLSNNLYRLRFFSESAIEESKPNILFRFIKFIFRLITIIVLIVFSIIFFLLATIGTINFLHRYII